MYLHIRIYLSIYIHEYGLAIYPAWKMTDVAIARRRPTA